MAEVPSWYCRAIRAASAKRPHLPASVEPRWPVLPRNEEAPADVQHTAHAARGRLALPRVPLGAHPRAERRARRRVERVGEALRVLDVELDADGPRFSPGAHGLRVGPGGLARCLAGDGAARAARRSCGSSRGARATEPEAAGADGGVVRRGGVNASLAAFTWWNLTAARRVFIEKTKLIGPKINFCISGAMLGLFAYALAN